MGSPQLLEGPGGIPGSKLQGATGTNKPFTFGSTVAQGGVTNGKSGNVASAATVSLTPSNAVMVHTPTQNETINFTTNGFTAGAEVWLEIVTSGASSFALTFGANTKNQGVLNTGTTTAKTFLINFVFDGTNWVEVSRTAAM